MMRIVIQNITYRFVKWIICYAHAHELYIAKFKLKFVGVNLKATYSFAIYNHKYISIGNNFSALYNLRLEAFDEYCGGC